MIIDFLTQNYEWFHPLTQCLFSANFLVYLLLLPKASPLLALRSDLHGNLYYIRMILDNPPTGCNSRIEQMLDYAQYLSWQDFSTKGARSLIVTGAVLSLVMATQGALLLTVSNPVEGLSLATDAVLSIALSVMFLMLAIFPLVLSWSNRRDAAKFRREAGKATAEYYLMLSDRLPQSGQVDETETAYENETEKDWRGEAI